MAPLLELRGVRREFPAGDETLTVLRDVDLVIHAGEMVAIVGASGSGKSTLMNILGCLDRPTYGTYRVAGRATGSMSADELAELRREHFGFIFQRYHLLGDLSAQANVEMPAVYAGLTRTSRRDRATALLERLGLGDRRVLDLGQHQEQAVAADQHADRGTIVGTDDQVAFPVAGQQAFVGLGRTQVDAGQVRQMAARVRTGAFAPACAA